ncbi:hypothetical protein D210916BOD24_19970 [Alteromonas sp. D210916BOD_24]|uniref:hypothetical protein n=1 Tax=Alteromonas sp. D210916BOD_24 TaxID=3157618 RepID=UPI00399CC3CC
MDVSSVNSGPVSTLLESPNRPAQQQVEPRNDALPQASQPTSTQQSSSATDERLGSRVDVFV